MRREWVRLEYLWEHLLDADAADWITVAAYLVAAWLCRRAAAAQSVATSGREVLFWTVSAWGLVLLGINEVFDFQSLLTLVAKDIARSDGWYENRRPIQIAFIFGLGLFGLLLTIGVFWFVRSLSTPVKIAVAGFMSIGIFILFRAASFHKMDAILGSGLQAFNLGSIQEMAGIVIVALAAITASRPTGGDEPA